MIKTFVCILLLLLLTSCMVNTQVVVFDIAADCTDVYTRLIQQAPLPKISGKDGDCIVTLSIRSWEQEVATDASALEKVVQCRWFAPTAFIGDDMDNVMASDAVLLSTILPLDEVALPRKALSYNHLYPTDANYALTKKWIVAVKMRNRRTRMPAALLAWFNALPEDKNQPEIAWIGSVGDIMPGEGAEQIFLSAQGIQGVFTNTLPILQKTDLLLGNLEAVATTYDIKVSKAFNYKFQPEILGLLTQAGFDYFSISNNHNYDYGETGFKDTLKYLAQYRIPTSGAGLSLKEAVLPWRTVVKGLPVSIQSLSAYPVEWNGYDGYAHATATASRAGILWADAEGLKAVEAGCSPQTFDIVMVHGGIERTLHPADTQVALYRQLIDLGVDLVIGAHPHALQDIEVYHDKLIVYSLANFIFPDEVIYPYAKESVICLVGIINQQIKYLKFYPVHMQGAWVELDPERKGVLGILTSNVMS